MTSPNAINYLEYVPTVLKRFEAASGEIGNTELEPKLRHLIELRASQINQCAYCVKMHTEEALRDGETDKRLQRITVWRHVGDYTAAEKAAFAWTEALTSLDPATDYETLRVELRQHYSDAQISALTSAIAMINLWNRMQVSNH
ncbi:carboxymuconolactone decarboxylase family protein [Roseibium sp. SCPC15]|uniref:carboxymuconolactone decarboxylase family protein n=1 Tax=Roseibium sp. SCP15 TaxID=3141376 RepID=UPI00333ADE54